MIEDLRNEIKLETAGSSDFEIEAFARVYARRLEDAEQIFDLAVESLQCRGPRGKRLELLGYAEDSTDDSLVILAGAYFGSDETLTLTAAKSCLARSTGFIELAAEGWLNENLEISSREAEYADYFNQRIASGAISKIRAVLITDGIMSNRIKQIPSTTIGDLKVSYEVWDQTRILDAAKPETRSEDIEIDLTRWIPDGLPCLVANTGDSSLPSYLAILPGNILADIFEEYGSLLLESNVRTFLSARGSVNRGIQETLRDAPDRFLAYNNGLTTTSVHIDIDDTNGVPRIRTIRGWQIVNGGQTTSSLAHFLRTGKDRSLVGVAVQLKLVVVDPEEASEVVHAVAKYANSQNKISGADLFSTHEFHIRMEQISRRLRAPAKESQQFNSGWYYERARGQWENDRTARISSSEQKKFELEYPKSQRITKTDWAKYAYCWGKKPHLVSKGAQSVFADYAIAIDKLWNTNETQFNDAYFRSNISKAILYEVLRSNILKQNWYKSSPGYLANIVAYTISKFSFEISNQFATFKYDFEKVWQDQNIGHQSLAALLQIAELAQLHLTAADRPQANVTQWAKQQACWERFSYVRIKLDPNLVNELRTKEDNVIAERDARRERAFDNEYELVKKVISIPKDIWAIIYSSGDLSPSESDLVRKFGSGSGIVPNRKQASVMIKLIERMVKNGTVTSKEV